MTIPGLDGKIIDRATKFGERFGYPALLTTVIVIFLGYGAYYVLRYEVAWSRAKVEALESQVNATNFKIDGMSSEHSLMRASQEAELELQSQQVCIQCAACINDANTLGEIKRCNCVPCPQIQ